MYQNSAQMSSTTTQIVDDVRENIRQQLLYDGAVTIQTEQVGNTTTFLY